MSSSSPFGVTRSRARCVKVSAPDRSTAVPEVPTVAAAPVRRLVLGSHREIAGTVYGTTVVMATVVAGSRDSAADPWGLAVITGATVVVLWLAHVYSGALADSINRSQPLNRRQLGAIAGQEISIPLAAVAPVGALALAGADVVQLRTAVWVALGIGV